MDEVKKSKLIITGLVWLQIIIMIAVFYLITQTLFPLGIAFLAVIGAIITKGVWTN